MTSPEITVELNPENVLVTRYRFGKPWLRSRFEAPAWIEAVMPRAWSGLLPPGVVAMSPKGKAIVYLDQPGPHLFRIGTNPWAGLYRIHMPHLLYKILDFAGSGYQVSAVVALNSPDWSEARAFSLPLPNLYTDGEVCIARQDNVTDDLAQGISRAIEGFWSSGFNYEVEDFGRNPFYAWLSKKGLNPWECWEILGSDYLFQTANPGFMWVAHAVILGWLEESEATDEDVSPLLNRLMSVFWPPIPSSEV